ncbi:transcriptional regulator NrdR [Dissulfurimicrobium hydrothermale]|uniref:transcriptional regulator NrdR n=1 Tax=Dissulfurimicrobium hydrothermale TaxID=1750598 RepID=UPI001EDB6C42|nr:transcriptional regulator NrdR [Dissulfurimicrobium hydrothermale]UKL14572.1 transcriptional regulator NrdR [Dissulfurimicrobium hydrothermale]
MKCPFCSASDSRVIDSRLGRDGRSIRRRRECISCGGRFTTYERVEEFQPMVVKKDGRREPFDRRKVIDGIMKACEKRPVSVDQVEAFVTELEGEMQERGEREVPSSLIGERVMERLKEWDDVAYVRFASVYRQFKDLNEFMEQLLEMLHEEKCKKS